jgi:OHCU decarboxylase
VGLEHFNSLSREEAEAQLYSCFAHRDWAARLAAGRPYQHRSELLASAESAWSRLGRAGWLEAFAAHPRIGERGGHAPATSEREQSNVMAASHETLTAIGEENRRYEDRFGHVFLIAASGRSGEEILQSLRQRMANDPEKELSVAAAEQRKITQLRLEELLG